MNNTKIAVRARVFRGQALLVVVMLLAGVPAAAFPSEGQAGIEELKKKAPKVFIDCSDCDSDYIRTEITFVNYVRDRKEAGVHILITTLYTGGGGREYTLSFIGQNEYEGLSDVHHFYSKATDSDEVKRSGLVKALKLGLARYAARTPISERMTVSYKDEKRQEAAVDRWHNWVFSLSGSGIFSGEESYGSMSLYFNASANHVTPEWKLRLSLGTNYNRSTYVLTEGDLVSTSQSQNFQGMLVKNIGDHWSIGGFLSASSSTYSNVKIGFTLAPAIEYNLFPYAQSTRRQLRFLYRIGYLPVTYREETIYEKTREDLFKETLEVTLELKEKWGTISASLIGSHYFHDLSKNNLELYSSLALNLVEGLAIELSGGASLVHDQLGLPMSGATRDEILLRRREIETSYTYWASIGVRITFGSIFTNVVNPRFGSGSRGYMINMSM